MKRVKRPVVRTALSSILIALTLAVAVVANVMIPPNMNVINGTLGDNTTTRINQPETYTDALDLQYNKADYTAEEMAQAERQLNEEIMGEGVVLLQNNDAAMPFAPGTSFSFFGRSSTKVIGNAMYDIMLSYGVPADPGTTLKTAFEEKGFQVNAALWDFYSSGAGKDYGLGTGSISWGDAEDFSINECPLRVLESEPGLLDGARDTVPVFVWRRNVGEGRDMPRSMYNHAQTPEDQARSYLEPDSTELEILAYLNEHYDNVVLLVNASAAMELGWVQQFPSIKSVVYMPSNGMYGLYALADIFSGAVSPSGHTVDTFAFDAASAPAYANYGDFQYSDENGQLTKYNYVNYKEGIYVGYRYYETRYEDAVMGAGNAGDYDYASTVQYPLGYGLSYTTFQWSDYTAQWNGDECTVSVKVTNTGSVPGKEVVQVYAQKPYTDYDREHQVEKSAVDLVGFAKTGLLAPGASETVAATFDREQLKSYDAKGAKTYILDAGDYYITAAANAHEAVNNILAAKGYTVEDGMTAPGDAAMTAVWNNPALDTSTYAVSAAGAAVTNRFDFADSGCTYLSRSDWQGTWPATDGQLSGQLSTWGNPINGQDGASYTWTKPISAQDLARLDSFDSLSPIDRASFTETPVYNANNGVTLIQLRGKDYDDPLWQDLLDNLTAEQYQTVLTTSGYGTIAMPQIAKPAAMDYDAATGLFMGGTGMSYCGTIVLAQTWNAPLAERYGQMIGNEALIGGCAGWYAPAMNIHRLPFSGRNNEYYSEDGFLSGVIAAASSRGAASKGMYTFLKHFAVNDQENHRGDRPGQFSMATWANEQSIREIYLLPFQMCVENEPITLNYLEEDGSGGYKNATRQFPAVTALMTAFNRLGYTWTGGCYPLLTDVLKTEWGFNGFIITDAAHTGLFMDGGQMIEAGGSALLTNAENVRWTFDETDPADYHYAREALHGILYAVANSKVMNGLMPGSEIVTPLTIAEKVLISINVVSAVLVALLAAVIFFGWRKYIKQARAAKAGQPDQA